MKLNEKQLRQLVRGVLTEGMGGESVQDALYGDLMSFCEAFQAECMADYDPRDPVQAEYGRDAWQEQCEEASLDLENQISRAVDIVYQNLHNGEYGGDIE